MFWGRTVKSSAIRAGFFLVFLYAGGTAGALAQDQGTGDTPPVPPADATPSTSTTPPVVTTPTPTPPQAPSVTAPTPPNAPAAATPAQQGVDPATTEGQQRLPDVEVIQTTPAPNAVTPKARPAQVAKPKQVPIEPQPVSQPVESPDPSAPPQPTNVVGPPPANTQVRVSPIGGSEIPLEKVPSNVGTASAAQISAEGSAQVQQALQQSVPGIIITDIGGSGFRTDVSYRGFDASSVGGRAQGLAVYQNGVRINEAFGDTVNFDIIPSNAIQDITVISSNPVFGLNAIGGAISIVTKDGFGYEGGEIDALAGSFGRRQVGVQAGGNSSGVSAYVAAQRIEEDGFRDFSEAEISRFFGDVGFKGANSEFHLSLTAADSSAGVVAAAPLELLRADYGNTFTSPQNTELEVLMPTLSGKIRATETLTFSGVGYFRRLKQRVVDGNLSEAEACSFDATILCLEEDGLEEPLETPSGGFIPTPIDPIGSIERINTDADSYGTAFQAVEKTRLFNRPNQFLVGVSYDHGSVGYQTSSEVGTIGPKFVVTGTGAIVVEPDDLAPRNLDTENDYYGVYFSNTLDVTDDLSVTVGGRYNHATIQLEDLTGEFPELNTTNKYDRFNPTAGATYRLMPGLSVYGNYAEANRAPTAAELGCAEPENPCFIESFLTDDPPLQQVVSKGFELGIRGEATSVDRQRLTWSLGVFRTTNFDDILNVAATATGRGFFLNAGDTLRQGFEAAIGYHNDRLSIYGSYALIDATFRDDLILPAPNTPNAETCPDTDPADEIGCNFVQSGDHLPGIPRHRFKAGIEYWLTPQWKVGSDLVASSDQFFFGDEANNNTKLPGYARVDLRTSYDLTENFQIYGLVKNIFDRRYGLYGTFFSPEDANDASSTTGVTFDEDEARSITPSLPFAAYGGIKIKF